MDKEVVIAQLTELRLQNTFIASKTLQQLMPLPVDEAIAFLKLFEPIEEAIDNCIKHINNNYNE